MDPNTDGNNELVSRPVIEGVNKCRSTYTNILQKHGCFEIYIPIID